MPDGDAIAFRYRHDCEICDGELDDPVREEHRRETVHMHFVCESCGAGGTAVLDLDGTCQRRVGPALDAREAARKLQRERLMADGGHKPANPRESLIAAEVALSEEDLARAEDALLETLSRLRQRKQEVATDV